MITACMYHDKCLDGMAAAWVLHRLNPDVILIPMMHGDKPSHILDEKVPTWRTERIELFVLDFSFKRDMMIFLARNTNLAVIDHHISAQIECEDLDFCIFDLSESGATLTWHQLCPNEPLPLFLKYVRDGDLWQFEMPAAQEIRAYLQSFPFTMGNMYRFETEFNNNLDQIIIEGSAIARARKNLVDIMTSSICIAEIGGFQVPVVNATVLASEVTNKLCMDWPQYPFSACYADDTRRAIRRWRLTSIGEFDVSQIAKIYGGGGHVNAAGFEQILGMEQVHQDNPNAT